MTSKEMLMYMRLHAAVRELDHRNGDGIDVRLLWNSQEDRVTVVVEDSRSGASFELVVDPADALAAFYHPFTYARRDQPAEALATRNRGTAGET